MLVSSVALGVLAGLIFRGDWRKLRDVRILWWPLALIALSIRFVALILGLPFGVHLAAILLVTAVASRNWLIPGALLVAGGSALNALVIVLNGAMPFDSAAAAAAGAIALESDALHRRLGPETRLPWLADVLPMGLFRAVYSVGDVIIAAGGFWIPFSILRRR
jgi:hypothetical protein